jgi:hypothetical protein
MSDELEEIKAKKRIKRILDINKVPYSNKTFDQDVDTYIEKLIKEREMEQDKK